MSINDPISLQVFFWLSAVVLVTLLICASVVGHRTATAWGERSGSDAVKQKEIARTAEWNFRTADANARQMEMAYQKALLERVGEIPPISLSVPQEQVDKLAMDYVKRRIESVKVTVEK